MSSKSEISRRLLLQTGVAAVGLVVIGCKSKPAEPATCTDTTGLSADDLAPRTSLTYQDRSPDPAKTCDKCVQFVEPASAGSCGGCKVLKGPISPAGTCKVWAAKTT
jgi:hypothetical protein